jgi:hypothetical protein
MHFCGFDEKNLPLARLCSYNTHRAAAASRCLLKETATVCIEKTEIKNVETKKVEKKISK